LHLVVDDILAGRHTFYEERNLPAGLGDYYAKMIRDADRGIGTGSLLITNLAAQLCWAREPLSEETLATLLDLMMPNSPQLRKKLSTFLRIGHVLLRRAPDATGAPGYALYHDAVRNYLRNSDEMEMPCEQALFMLLKWCSRWREHQTHYALRHYPSHLREAGRIEDLYTLARDQEFLDAQASSFYDEPRVPLETLHLALEVAIERQNLPEIIEFCYACARRRGSIVRESPLEEVCDSDIEPDRAERRARNMIGQLADVNDQFLWWLILAVEYVERRDFARAVALIRAIPREHFHGRFDPDHQRCALVLLTELADLRGIEQQRRLLLRRLNADHQRRLCILLAKCGKLDAASEVLEQISVEDEAVKARREFIKALAAIEKFSDAWREIDRLPQAGPKGMFERGWATVDMIEALAEGGDFESAWKVANQFGPERAWQRARALQFIARSQLRRFGWQSGFLKTLSESRSIIESFREGSGRDRHTKARALAELASIQARLNLQSLAARTFREALDMALSLPSDAHQLKLLTGLLWNLDAAAREKPRFARLFQQTVEDLLSEERRWRNFPAERSDFAKLIATLQAEQQRFAEAFQTAGTIVLPDVRADALGRIADGLQRSGKSVREILRRLPVRNRLLVAAQIGEGLIAEGRPGEVRFLIAEQLVALASLQSAHVWGRPLLRGSLAAAFFRARDAGQGRELFRQAEAVIDRLPPTRRKPKAFAACDLAMNLGLAGETVEAIRGFAKAKTLGAWDPLVLAQICAREAEVGLRETAEVSLAQIVVSAHRLGATKPARAVEIFGEIAVSFVRLQRFDRAEEAIQALITLLPKIVEARTRAKAAAEAAVQIAKAGTTDGRCYAWAETLVQAARDVCRDTEHSMSPVREPGQVWRVEAILLGADGKLAEAEAKARRNSHTEHQTRGLRDVAELCLHFEQPARAFEVCLMIQHDRSKMLPDMMRHFLKHSDLNSTLRLLGYATDYLDGAYRLISQILRHAPTSIEDLQKVLAWLDGLAPKPQP
jgi:tetratricopeptide (TPR) repeat protein